MSTRGWPALSIVVLVVLPGCVRSEERAADLVPLHQHVLLLTVDTLRADHLSCAGYELPTTPFLDSLLAEGVHFTRALATVPRTTPSLASLLTGAYPHTTGVRTLYDRLLPGMVSLAELLKQRGYTTIAVISNHILTAHRSLNRGFDVYDAADDSRDARTTTDAVFQYLAGRSSEEPLFIWVHYIDPHVPYRPPLELAVAFDPGYEGRYRLNFGTMPTGGIGGLAYPEDLPKPQAVFQNALPPEVNAHIRRLYAADIRATDDQIARLVQGLRAAVSDWLIIFTADHGESLGEHDFYYDHGDYVYGTGLQVPLGFVLPPGDPRARKGHIEEWVSLVDVMPTLLELLHLELPAGLARQIEGRSLVPYLEGRDIAPRAVFAECGMSFFPKLVRRRVHFDVAGRFRTVVLGDWKLIWTPGQRPDLEFELYDLAADPAESTDLYAPDRLEARRLKALLRAWYRPVVHQSAGPSEEDLRRLRSLGYVQ